MKNPIVCTRKIDEYPQAFQSLIPPHPDAPVVPPPSAHLYLAQLSEDDPKLALEHYQAAVNILLGQLKGKVRAEDENSKNDDDEIKSNIIRALIGQVEIWMDPSYDLWYVNESVINIDVLSQVLHMVVLIQTQRKTARIFFPLPCKPIPETLRRYRHYPPLGYLSSVQKMPNNALSRRGQPGKTSTLVSFIFPDRHLSKLCNFR